MYVQPLCVGRVDARVPGNTQVRRRRERRVQRRNSPSAKLCHLSECVNPSALIRNVNRIALLQGGIRRRIMPARMADENPWAERRKQELVKLGERDVTLIFP